MVLIRVLVLCLFVLIIQEVHGKTKIGKISKSNRTQFKPVEAPPAGTIFPERTPNLNHTKMVGGNFANIEDYKWFALIYDFNADYHVTYAAVINMYWMIAPGYNLPYYIYVSGADQLIFADIAYGNYYDPVNADYTRRYIQEVQRHPNFNTPKINDIGLIRFCPSIDSSYFAPLPAPGTTYSTGDVVSILNHEWFTDDFEIGVKNVGENCECDLMDGWNPAQHICIQESSNVYLENGDYEYNAIVINDKFTGFVLEYSDNSGELAVNVASFIESGGYVDTETSDINWLIYE